MIIAAALVTIAAPGGAAHAYGVRHRTFVHASDHGRHQHQAFLHQALLHRASGHRAFRYQVLRHHAYGTLSHRWRQEAALRSLSPRQTGMAAGGTVQEGRASFYAGEGRTANGSTVGSATCAHRSLPFGTKILVTNLANARQAILTVNDRGPFVHGRMLDVSRGAAGLLGMLHAGVSQIRMQVLGSAG